MRINARSENDLKEADIIGKINKAKGADFVKVAVMNPSLGFAVVVDNIFLSLFVQGGHTRARHWSRSEASERSVLEQATIDRQGARREDGQSSKGQTRRCVLSLIDSQKRVVVKIRLRCALVFFLLFFLRVHLAEMEQSRQQESQRIKEEADRL